MKLKDARGRQRSSKFYWCCCSGFISDCHGDAHATALITDPTECIGVEARGAFAGVKVGLIVWLIGRGIGE